MKFKWDAILVLCVFLLSGCGGSISSSIVTAEGNDTERFSVASDGSQGNNLSTNPAISGDGRYVTFGSAATNLVVDDTNSVRDIFVHDRDTDITERISVASDGSQSNNLSTNSAISSNGRYVIFSSAATNLVVDDTNSVSDIFVHDRDTDITERISVASDGSQSNNLSTNSAISSNGRYVTFSSAATNLVVDDTNSVVDIFVHDRETGTTERISVASDGGQSNNQSTNSAISSYGRYVTFSSTATNLVADDTNSVNDIFVHDRDTGITERVSVGIDGSQSNDLSTDPAISNNGRYVTFDSTATNLVMDDTNNVRDIFVHDRDTGISERISVASDSSQSNNLSTDPAISEDGRYVIFSSAASNLVVDDTNNVNDIFVHDRDTGISERVSVASDSSQSNNLSANPAISGDGLQLVFDSNATNLVVDDTNASSDIFVHSRSD